MLWTERLFGPASGRRLVIATLVSTFGSGVFASTAVFYLTGRGATLPAVGTWMTIGGTASIIASPQIAMLLARLRPGLGLVALHLARAAIFFMIPGLPISAALPLISAAIVLDKASAPTLQAFVTISFPGADRLRVLGYRRAVANFGLGAGTAAGGLLLVAHTDRALTLAFIVNAATFIYAAIVIWSAAKEFGRSPGLGNAGRGARRSPGHVRGRIALVALYGSLTIYDVLLTFGIPTVVLTSHIALWWSAVALGLSFAIVTGLQVPMTVFIDKREISKARLGQVGGVLIAAGCLLIASVAQAYAIVGLIAAVVCWSLAEIAVTNILWRLPLTLEDDPVRMSDLIAQLSLGNNAAVAVMPLVIATLVAPFGAAGWLALASLTMVPTFASSARMLRDDAA